MIFESIDKRISKIGVSGQSGNAYIFLILLILIIDLYFFKFLIFTDLKYYPLHLHPLIVIIILFCEHSIKHKEDCAAEQVRGIHPCDTKSKTGELMDKVQRISPWIRYNTVGEINHEEHILN